MLFKQLISVSGRAEAGASRPFLCEDNSGQSLFVKRGNVTWDQLVIEFVIGRLAKDFGIQVAAFDLVKIPEGLARQSLFEEQLFEPGFAFGSVRVPFAEELGESHLGHISEVAKIELICFDWWVGNIDRRLSYDSASSNLLWSPEVQEYVAIDHDRCLSTDIDETEFFREHIFKDVRSYIDDDKLNELRKRFEKAVKKVDQSWQQLPGEWVEQTELTCDTFIYRLLEPRQNVAALVVN